MSTPPLSAADIAARLRFDAEQRRIFDMADRYNPGFPGYQPVVRSRGGLHHLRKEVQAQLAAMPPAEPPTSEAGDDRKAAGEVAGVGEQIPDFSYYPPLKRRIARSVSRAVLFLVGIVTAHQRVFNRAILRLVDHLRRDLDAERRERLHRNDQLLDLLEAGEIVEAALIDVDRRLEAVEHRLGEVRQIATFEARLQEMEQRVRRVAEHAEAAERDARLGFQTAEARNAYYLAFEDRFRGSASVIRQRLEVYDPLVEQLPREASDLAIDLGAGRGEWLDLLRDHGLRGIGIDVNARMVAACRENGHEASEGDALEFLEGLDDDSVAMVTGFHLIEHLSFDYLVSLVDQTLRVLVPGGVALFETPNPENVFTSSCYFHMDFTHVRPIPPASSQFLLEQRGFSEVEILRQNVLRIEEPKIQNIEAEHPLAGRLNPAIDILNQRFLDAPDYAVIGTKPT